jgi:hypothetical protein
MISESFCNRRYSNEYPNPGVPTESDQSGVPQDRNLFRAKKPGRFTQAESDCSDV